jgi:hypothetical protein
MTRTNYQKFAEFIYLATEVHEFDAALFISNLCAYFEEDNPNFDREKFIEACTYGRMKDVRDL